CGPIGPYLYAGLIERAKDGYSLEFPEPLNTLI
ncbi:MAG: hypothetical protein XD82_1829, partial [Methanoculleus marisnigri]